MNIDNVVLVRAMNNVPLNGELVPSCEGQRLVNDRKSDFYYFMKSCVREQLQENLGRYLDLYPDSPDEQLMNEACNNYSILTGDYYTSTLSFSLNGLVPDDMNNKFADMNMAVLEPLRNQTTADFVTIETIDTTTKGRMQTSSEAILTVKNDFFAQLSPEIQQNLITNFNVRLFDGKLKDAISDALKENGYPVLPLIQNREMKNIDNCPEKQSMLDFEEKFSMTVGASRERLQNLTFMYGGGTGVDEIAHNKISEEHENTLIVTEHYKNQFYGFMLRKAEALGIEVSDEDRFYLFTSYEEGTDAMKRVTTALINAYGGFEKFQSFINEYNQYTQNNYLTNQEIVSLSNNKQM